ncbi:MAG: ABC transporter transmembrane domain-containing protein, partial [Nitriliruptoraceae bacterium]
MRSLLDTVHKVRELIGGHRRWRWWVLLALAIVVSGLEALGASLVYALVGLVASPQLGQVPLPLIGDVSGWFPDVDPDTIRIGFAIGVALFFVGRSAVVLARAYVQERLTNNAGVMLASELLRGYLAMPYVLHTRRSSAELVRNTYESTQLLVNQALRPLVTLLAESILALGLLAVLLVTAPLATLLAGLVFVPTLWVLQGWIQPRLKTLGQRSQAARTGSIAAVQQSLGAIRDIKLLDRASDFATAHASQRFVLAR